jgi:carbonic anhydrase
VKHLKVEHIVVIWHWLCGGIKALVTMEEVLGRLKKGARASAFS